MKEYKLILINLSDNIINNENNINALANKGWIFKQQLGCRDMNDNPKLPLCLFEREI